MNPLNLNPKILHIIMEIAQIGGTLGAVASIAGTFNPLLGTACGVAGGIATVLKTQIISKINQPSS